MKKFNKDMTIGDALKLNKKAEAVLLGFGMHCLSCPFSLMETLEQASAVHGIDSKDVLDKLNELQTPKKLGTIKLSKKR